ncbi:MAG: polyphosphate kinase 1, partial [Verrucomicrobiota bacterium]
MNEIPFRSKEVSWLSFNARVLQEAQSPDVPLLERLKFLGIYSANLDEFFRVRVATLRRLIKLGIPHAQLGIPDPKVTFNQVNSILKREALVFNETYTEVFRKLEQEGISLIRETEVPPHLRDHLESFFEREVLPHLMPILIKGTSKLGGLKDHPMYLAIRMTKGNSPSGRPSHAILEIPLHLPRFHVLHSEGKKHLVMYLDDVIRFGLHQVFASTSYDQFDSYALKFTRDAEMEFDDDITESFYDQIEEGIKSREEGNPVRLNYDADMPSTFLRLVVHGLEATGDEDSKFPGARYHNRKDLMSFPSFGRKDLKYRPPRIVIPSQFQREEAGNLFATIREKDQLLHFPYHSYQHFIDLLRQASLDPLVKSISLTQYRLASNSAIARCLLAATRNGKEVAILVEPTARFDEEANLQWASLYRDAGVKVYLGVRGLKVHAKLCLIERTENGKARFYSCLGTGNFNEDTARFYTDHMLLTYDQDLGDDVRQIFRFFRRNYAVPDLKRIICAPFSLRDQVFAMIDAETKQAREGKPAEICI